MRKTTDFDLHLKRLFLWEYVFELLALAALVYAYRYVYVLHGGPVFLKLVMALAAPALIVLVMVRINIVNFRGVLDSIPQDALEPRVVEHIIKMTAFLNVREAALLKAGEGIILMDREQLMEITPRLMLRFIRLALVSGRNVPADAARYAARTTGDPGYTAAVDNNGLHWITGAAPEEQDTEKGDGRNDT